MDFEAYQGLERGLDKEFFLCLPRSVSAGEQTLSAARVGNPFVLSCPDLTKRAIINEALAAINSVHPYHTEARLNIRLNRGQSMKGHLYITSESPNKIILSQPAPAPGLAVLHQLGHLLDWQKFGVWGEFSSCSDPRFSDWWQAIQNSSLYHLLEEMLPTLVEDRIISEKECLSFSAPEELWARSYTQFIIEASKKIPLLEELEFARCINEDMLPEYWSKDDFAPISRALRTLLESKAEELEPRSDEVTIELQFEAFNGEDSSHSTNKTV